MGTPVNIVVGSHVWVEDPVLAWIDGEVFEIKNHQVHVNTTSGKTVVADVSKVFPKDTEAPPGGVDDMTKLSYLHEPGVLENLGVRFAQNEIYTYTGNILIAINPFQRLPHLNSQEVMERYKGADIGELSPHVFAIAEAAYRAMIHERKSNSVLVSGESGAGKTETTKMLMRYLAFLGGRAGSEERSVEQQVLESNPVLEAFGNAKTIRNNNSSRFGKFVEIQFDDKWKISGAAVRTYLLERSRVCQINSPERNYHAFYFLCAAPSEDIKKYKLADPKTFHYLNQSTCIKVDRIDDAYEYLETRRAMDIVGINEQDQEAIFRVVASILHLGNVDFAKGKEADSSVIKDEKSRFHLETTAELLMCDSKKLEKALVTRLIVTREEVINRALDPASALISRDGLAKTLYSRLFDWLVETINKSIGQDPNSKQLIGVLDIYGFESFKTNSFEQLCINFTNEKLQQHFNQHVFKMEQEEYTREDIKWSYIEYVDNTDVLDLIEKKPGGVIALLDEACMFPRATYETFAQKMYQTFKNHKRFTKPKLSRTDFTISHYAGDVTYQADYFLDKNKDYIVAEHQELLNASKCSFVSGLFPPLPEESSKSTKFSSIGTRFKLQLQSLMETLNSTEPHYIRCVKPNNLLKPSIFEKFNISQQLRCNGVLEAIRISCAGFPTRKTFQEFINRFKILAPEVLEGNYDEKIACQKLLDKAGLVGYQIGKTKVFLRAGQMAELDARRTEVLGRAARTIQRQVKTHIAHKEFLKLRRLSIIVQSHWRGRMACKLFKYMRREAAAVKIQKNLRQHFARKLYTQLRSYAITLQTGLRAMAARKEFRFRKHARAATHIQAQWRRHRDFSCYQALKKATLIYQCAWRRRLAGKELKKLKMAAKETGALKDAKDKLEKRVEELISLLELEKQLRIDLEETKALEIAKLQDMLLAVQLQVEEANATIIKEREAPPAAQEVPVFVQDTEKINSLTADIEKLEGLLLSERQATDAAKTELAKAQERDEELLQKSEEAERKYHELEALLSERQLTEEAKEELAEAQERNEELLKKSEDAERKIDEIQALFEAERQSTDVAKKELAETRESIEELLKKFEDSERKVDELQVSLLSEKQATDESKEALEKLLEKSQDAERKIDELEALLLSERQSTGETKTAFSEAHARNKELLEKSEDAERKNDELYALLLLERQSTDLAKNELAESQKKIEESLKISEEAKRKIGELQALLLSERQETDEVKKALAEAQERNEESHVKSEDSERKFDKLQALFLSERQSSDAAKKELAKAEERNEDLLKKSEDAERKNDQLQALLLSEKQAMDAAKKALGESEERNKESCLKYEVAERKIDELQAKFLSERESNCAAKKELSEAQETNKGLVKKYEDAERKIEQLQGLLFLERQAADAANKALSEAQGRNKDSYEKFEYATTNFLQLQALILSERQSTDEARRALAEANVKSKELLEKSKESERKIDDLQVLLLSEKQATDAANEALAEAQEKSKESRVKFEDAERKIIELQALFLLERQSTDAAKKELAEAQEINEQLIMKSENAERTLEQLQALLLSERQATAEVSIALAEAHERNQRLLEKAEDAERKTDELQTLFLSERQSTDAAKKELAEAQLRNEELLVKSEDAKKKINQLEALMFSERQAIDETKKALGEAQKKNEELCVRFEDAERKIDEIQALFLSERQSNDAAKMELAKATERIGELLKQSEDFQRKIDELQVQLLSVKQSTDAAKKELAEVQDRNKELYKKSEDSDRKNEQLQGMLLLERQATDAAKHALAEAQERNKESYDKFDYAVRNFLQLQAMVLSEKQSTDEAKKALAEANIRNKELLEKSEDADRKIDELQSLLLSESQSIDAAKKALAEAEERNEESHMKSEDAERKIAELQAQLLSERQSTEAAKKELSGAQEKNEEITRKYEDVERKFEQLQALLLSERQETNEAKKTLAEANERNKELLKKSEDTERKTDELQALFLSERQSTDEANKKLSEAQERIQELLKKSEDAERKIDQLQALLISESQATDGTKKALAESEKRNEEAHVKFKYAQRKIDELQAMFLSERQSTGAAKKGLAEAWERNNELIRRSEDAERKIEHLQALFLIERQATDAAKKALAVAQEMLLSERQSTDAAKRELSEAMTRNKRLHEKSENAERKIKQLQVSLLSERQATDTTKKALAEAQQRNVQLLKKSEDAESKIDQLENTIERLEEEVSDLKSDNDLLHQKAISASPSAKSSAACPKPTNIQKTSENGKLPNDKTKPAFDTTPKVFETEEKSKGSFIEMQQENEDLLISCISKDLGFSGCKPVVACLIYKCLLHWGSFEVERTSVFDRIIQRINLVVEGQINVATLSYWLSNSSILLLLLQRKMKASGTPQRLRSSASMGVRVPPQSTELPSRSGRLSNLHKFEAKYPAQVFKQQLTVLLEKIYGIIRDNLKKEISPLLISCVQAPRVSRVRSLRRSQSHASAFGQQTLTSNWQSIVRSLTNYLKILRANYVPPILVRKVFTQIFLFINVQLFNSLLLRRECCSFSNGEYVKAGLDELERWCYGATEEYAGSALDELNHIRQAVGFLASHQKPTKSLNEIISDLCPVLSVQQLYRICTMYWDDKYGTNTISSDVVSGMSAMMIDESNSEVNSSFMLDDDSSVPFSVDDLAKSVKDIEIADADLPSAIRENPGFAFLLKRNEY